MQLAHTVNGYFIFDSSLCTNNQKGFRLSSVWECDVHESTMKNDIKLSLEHLKAINFRPFVYLRTKTVTILHNIHYLKSLFTR